MSELDDHDRIDSNVKLGPGVSVPRRALRFAFSRASGPGGQAVNKLSTRAQLRVAVAEIVGLDEFAARRLRQLAGRRLTLADEIILEAQTHRSQLDNKLECLERLSGLVAAAIVKPKVRKKKKPSRSMIQKRLESKRRRGQTKRLRSRRGDAES